MIFLTVGSEPFDRLIEAFENWVRESSNPEEVYAQIADAKYRPTSFPYVEFQTPSEYRSSFEKASLVVSHAGTGTIITALEMNKPIVVMPRRAALGETRNDHQMATVHHFQRFTQIVVANSESELVPVLNRTLGSVASSETISGSRVAADDWPADPALISFVREFATRTE